MPRIVYGNTELYETTTLDVACLGEKAPWAYLFQPGAQLDKNPAKPFARHQFDRDGEEIDWDLHTQMQTPDGG